MSKSKNNIINIFLEKKLLKKQIMSIETDSKPLDSPKNPETCNVFKIYSLLASNEMIKDLRSKYKNGGFGYGHAKKELLDLILNKFSKPREKYNYLMSNKNEIDQILSGGSKKASITANQVMDRVRKKLGY